MPGGSQSRIHQSSVWRLINLPGKISPRNIVVGKRGRCLQSEKVKENSSWLIKLPLSYRDVHDSINKIIMIRVGLGLRDVHNFREGTSPLLPFYPPPSTLHPPPYNPPTSSHTNLPYHRHPFLLLYLQNLRRRMVPPPH